MDPFDEIDHAEHAAQSAEQAVEQAAELCECWPLPPEMWTTHYGLVDPATTHEWNPDCPAHPPYSPSERNDQ